MGLLLALCLTAGACAAPTGDFGRPRPSYVNETVLPTVGAALARQRGEPVSSAALTDAEEHLRDRTYRFIMPVHRGFLAAARAELVRTRIWPDADYRVDPAAYLDSLRRQGFRSETGRYNAIAAEIASDTALLDPYVATVNEVFAADAARLAALLRTPGLTEAEEADALARVYENRRVALWGATALRWRVVSYRHALTRSAIEVPSARAAEAEAWLAAFEARVEALALQIDAAIGAAPQTAIVVKG